MAFLNQEFTRAISFHRVGGSGYNTSVNTTSGGQEYRNANWANKRAKYTVSTLTPATTGGVPTNLGAFAAALKAFFDLAQGKLNSFLYFDPVDSIANTQPLIATANPVVFQLANNGRMISKPITGGAIMDFNGNQLGETLVVNASTGYTVDATTGLVTFNSVPSFAPTASFGYDIPVRFDTDDFGLQVEPSDVGDGNPIVSWNSLVLLEVRPPNY